MENPYTQYTKDKMNQIVVEGLKNLDVRNKFNQIMNERQLMQSTQYAYTVQLCMFLKKNNPPFRNEQFKEFLYKRNTPTTRSVLNILSKATGVPIDIERVRGKSNKRKPVQFYSDEMFNKLLMCIQDDYILSLCLRLSRMTGLRRNEMINLTKNDIDIINQQIILRGKGNKIRTVFFTEQMAEELRVYFGSKFDEEKPFITEFKSGEALSMKIKKIISINNLPRANHHIICRHSFATNLVMKGVKIELVSKLMGHACLDTTMIYSHFNPMDLKNAWDKGNQRTR